MNNARHGFARAGLLPLAMLPLVMLLLLLLSGCVSQTTSSSYSVWTPYGGSQSSSFIQEEVIYLGPCYYPYAYGSSCRPCKGWQGRKNHGRYHGRNHGYYGQGQPVPQGLTGSPGSGLRAAPPR